MRDLWSEFHRNNEIESLCQEFDYHGLGIREVDGKMVTVHKEGLVIVVIAGKGLDSETALCDRDRLVETVEHVVRQIARKADARKEVA